MWANAIPGKRHCAQRLNYHPPPFVLNYQSTINLCVPSSTSIQIYLRQCQPGTRPPLTSIIVDDAQSSHRNHRTHKNQSDTHNRNPKLKLPHTHKNQSNNRSRIYHAKTMVSYIVRGICNVDISFQDSHSYHEWVEATRVAMTWWTDALLMSSPLPRNKPKFVQPAPYLFRSNLHHHSQPSSSMARNGGGGGKMVRETL
ncbi:hypothetical protein RIF29_18519 [Crotalaria pallida]|uniref:Uncharacterized protein n=1 Tax=Crotalaria pallida TaxID=3830 RepID=A0AAN9FST0_CROPI